MKFISFLNRGLFGAVIFTGSLYADPVPQSQVSFTAGSGSTWNLDWIGVPGRTYFAQESVDLVNWEYLPVLEFGTGMKGAGIKNTGAPKYFYRLRYVDEALVTTEQQARDADFDGDGIPNWFEVEDVGSDPLDRNSAGGDVGGNGLPDGWERYYFGGVGIAIPGAILKPDGLTNKEKADLGLDPNKDYSTPDSTVMAQYDYNLAGRLTAVTAPVGTGNYTPDNEGNLTDAH